MTLVMFLKLGWFGLVLLRLLLQMLIVFLVVLPLVKVWFLGVVLLVFGMFGLAVARFVRFVVMLLMFMMLLIFSCIETLLSPLLDMRRRFKAVMDVLSAMIRYGISIARSVELTAQWDRILAIGPLHLGEFHRIFSDVHRRLSDFIHRVVVHRRDEAIRGWRNWIREDPLVHPYKWLRPDLFLPAPFLQCKPHLTPGGSGVLADPAKIDEEFRKAWLPYFCRSGQRDTSLRNSMKRSRGGYLCCLCLSCLG